MFRVSPSLVYKAAYWVILTQLSFSQLLSSYSAFTKYVLLERYSDEEYIENTSTKYPSAIILLSLGRVCLYRYMGGFPETQHA